HDEQLGGEIKPSRLGGQKSARRGGHARPEQRIPPHEKHRREERRRKRGQVAQHRRPPERKSHSGKRQRPSRRRHRADRAAFRRPPHPPLPPAAGRPRRVRRKRVPFSLQHGSQSHHPETRVPLL